MVVSYLKDYSTAISENINSIKKKQELLDALEDDLIEKVSVYQVLCYYIAEVKRNIELEVEEELQGLMH